MFEKNKKNCVFIKFDKWDVQEGERVLGLLLERMMMMIIMMMKFGNVLPRRMFGPKRERCSYARYEGVWLRGGTASFIPNLGIRLILSVTRQPFYFRKEGPKSQYLLDSRCSGLQDRCRPIGEEKISLASPADKSRTLCRTKLNKCFLLTCAQWTQSGPVS